jgi:hypothetical protein
VNWLHGKSHATEASVDAKGRGFMSLSKRSTKAFLVVLAGIGCARGQVGRASEIAYNSFAAGDQYARYGSWFGTRPEFPEDTYAVAAQFTPTASGPLSELWVAINDGLGNPAPFTLSLHTGAASPDAVSLWEESYSGLLLGGSLSVFHTEVLGGPTLQAGTPYWLIAQGPETAAYYWGASSGTDAEGAVGLNFNDMGWEVFSGPKVEPFALRVGVVPEPSTLALLVAVGSVLGRRAVFPLKRMRGNVSPMGDSQLPSLSGERI